MRELISQKVVRKDKIIERIIRRSRRQGRIFPRLELQIINK